MTRRTLSAAGFICLLVQAAAAQQGAVHVLASNGMKGVVEELQPRCERAIGHPLSIEYNSTAALMQKIESGATFDVAILTSEAVAQLEKENKVSAGSRADFARSGIGLAVRSGAPKPDIGTTAALERTLKEAASIAYAKDGASREYIDKMLEHMGLAEEVKAKSLLTQGSGPAMASVASGQTAIVMTLMSELMLTHGIDIAGPLPAEVQRYVSFGAAAGGKAGDSASAKALIAYLRSAEAAPVYKAKGMEALPPAR
jgi:molybdate transport system substrate-binding protein